MPFQKGKPKTGGRLPGTPNATTRDLRERIHSLLEANFQSLVEDLETLEPKDRVNTWLRLLEFAVPKMQRMEAAIEEKIKVNPEVGVMSGAKAKALVWAMRATDEQIGELETLGVLQAGKE